MESIHITVRGEIQGWWSGSGRIRWFLGCQIRIRYLFHRTSWTKYKPEFKNSSYDDWLTKYFHSWKFLNQSYLIYKYFFFHFELRTDPDPIFFFSWAGSGSGEKNRILIPWEINNKSFGINNSDESPYLIVFIFFPILWNVSAWWGTDPDQQK